MRVFSREDNYKDYVYNLTVIRTKTEHAINGKTFYTVSLSSDDVNISLEEYNVVDSELIAKIQVFMQLFCSVVDTEWNKLGLTAVEQELLVNKFEIK